ncbi:hypothetical protein L798_04815 [Zootermopsis nevadensis]|uniref:Uncharacterized protein n=1 Tax=Zootermopsis nevadensis TaxID=136037 RepID=A0A067RKH9_ZOONE|nr:hypothetical protein L798_04815 [Zootermopsis nevadensis]
MKGGTVQWGEGGRARRTKKGRDEDQNRHPRPGRCWDTRVETSNLSMFNILTGNVIDSRIRIILKLYNRSF